MSRKHIRKNAEGYWFCGKYLPTDDRLKMLFGKMPNASGLNKELESLSNLSPREDRVARLKLIVDNMGLAGRWIGMSSTKTFNGEIEMLNEYGIEEEGIPAIAYFAFVFGISHQT